MQYRNRISAILLLLGLVALSRPQPAAGQYWTTRIDEAPGRTEVLCAADHGLDRSVLTGWTAGADGRMDLLTVCLDGGGDTLWTQRGERLPDMGDMAGVDVRLAQNGGVVVASAVWTATGWTALLSAHDADGAREWQRLIPLQSGQSILPRKLLLLENGTSVLLYHLHDGSGAHSGLASTTAQGSPYWSASEPGATLLDACAAEGNITAVGGIESAGQLDIYAVQYAEDGTRTGFISIDAASGFSDMLTHVTETADGVYAAGYMPDGNDDRLLTMMRWDGASTSSLHTLLGEYGAHRITDLIALPAGGVAVAARAENSTGGMEMLIGTYAADGTLLWTDRQAGSGGDDVTPPMFSGCTGGRSAGATSLLLSWLPAHDDVSMEDEIEYSVFAASASGAQDFSTPDVQVRGAVQATVDGLLPSTTYYIVVRASDREGNHDENTREFMFTTPGPDLRITTDVLPGGQVCQSYDFTLSAEGGTAPYTWAILTGALPNGITMDDDGRLTGEPMYQGLHSVTIGVQDADGKTATRTLNLIVAPAPRLLVQGSMTLPAGSHCYSSVIVPSDATLTFAGPARVRCTDSLIIDGTILADCAGLTFTGYSVAVISGTVDNRCVTGDSTQGGSLLFYSPSGDLSFLTGNPASGVFSHGELQLTDDTSYAEWEIAVPPEARSSTPLDPVAMIAADVLNEAILPGEDVHVAFTCEGLDPDGGPVRFALDFGDGETRQGLIPDNEAELAVEKFYNKPGMYLVTLTVEDDEAKSTGATLQILIGDSLSDGSEGLGAAISSNDLLLRSMDSVYFCLDEGCGATTTVASALWNFGDGQTSTALDPVYHYSQPGRYPVTCTVSDDSGNTAICQQSVYVYFPDTTAIRATASGAHAKTASMALQNRTVVIDAPVLVTRRIVFRGFQHMRLNPNANIHTRNGTDARPGGYTGQPGKGLSVYSPGWLIVNGARISAGNGGAGAGNTPNGSSGAKGGKGGSVSIKGRNVWIGGGSTISAGDGGDAGDVNVFKAAPGTARATAKAGGDAAARVRIRASNSVNFGGPTTIHTGNGGAGGNATATGGPGANKCTKAENGANAIARAGRGGKAGKRATIRGNVSGIENVTLTGGQGGDGGDATAISGDGGNATCETTARGGDAGWARAFGGDGGKSGHQGPAISGAENFKPGKGGDATASPGDGGTGSATPNPAQGKDGCPGEDGGDASGFGGKGGDGLAVTGAKGRLIGTGQEADPGNATVNGSNGGVADATGGTGGNGTTCDCDGGKGGNADAHGGLRGESKARAKTGGTTTINEGNDGPATVLAGDGGNGGHCCTPPAPVGGDGGNGGDADAYAGPNGGVGDAMAGSGGDGGDGKGPGLGGAGGTATSHAPAGMEIDGNAGTDGEWCFLVDSWYIYYSSIPDGVINPGTDITLGTYTDKDLATLIGQVDVHFMTQTELGMPMPPSYFKAGPQVFLEAGGMSIDMTSLTDLVDPSRTWLDNEFSMTFTMQSTTPGMLTMIGYENGQVIASREVYLDPALPLYTAGIAAPQGSHLETVSVVTDTPVSYDHWEVEIIVVDP